MPFAAAVSHHPVTAHATGEVVGAALDASVADPDLAVVAVTPGHAGALEDVAGVVRRLLSPSVLVGAVVRSLAVGGSGASRRRPAVALWCGTCGPVRALRLPAAGAVPEGRVVLLAASVPTSEDLERLAPVTGGVTGGLLALDGAVLTAGAAGAVLVDRAAGAVLVDRAAGAVLGGPHQAEGRTVLGLRPLGPPQRAGATTGRVLHELGGQPALDRLVALARDGVPADDLAGVGEGLHLSVLGHKSPAPIAVLGTERGARGLVLDAEVAEGATVQLLVRDAATLRAGLTAVPAAAGALAWGPDHHGEALWGSGREPPLPAATLWLEAAVQLGAAGEGSALHREATTLALFP